jgi:phospholipid/cholesterol/gamma-HCH transport system substrate-binding protein
VEITMSIEKQAQAHVRADARVKISTDGLVGNKIVVIYGGTTGAPVIAANDHLQAEHLAGLEDMMATLQANNTNLLAVTGNLKSITGKLTTGQGTLGALINDPSMADNIKSSLSHLQAASANSEKMIANLDNFTSGLQRQGSLANELVTDTTVFHHLKETMAKLNDAATSAATSSAAFAQTLKETGNGLQDPNTPLGMLLHNEDVAADFQRTMKNLRVSSKEMADDLEAVQHSFLLKGFFKKRDKE